MALPRVTEDLPDQLAIDRRIGTNVRTIMRARRVSGEEAGELLALNPGSVSKRLGGRVPFKAAELELLALRLQVDVSLFYEADLFRTGSR